MTENITYPHTWVVNMTENITYPHTRVVNMTENITYPHTRVVIKRGENTSLMARDKFVFVSIDCIAFSPGVIKGSQNPKPPSS